MYTGASFGTGTFTLTGMASVTGTVCAIEAITGSAAGTGPKNRDCEELGGI